MRMIGPAPEPIVVEEGEIVKFPHKGLFEREDYEQGIAELRELATRIKEHTELEGKEFLNWPLDHKEER